MKLELSKISKFFPGVKALHNVNFNLKKNSIHALIGENGAGKSTLVNTIEPPTILVYGHYDKFECFRCCL